MKTILLLKKLLSKFVGMVQTKEKWAIIAHTNGEYEVSTLGDIRNVNTGKVYTAVAGYNGNRLVCLRLGKGKRYAKTFSVSRVVAETFIPRTPFEYEVSHINGDKSDNRVENLRWVDRAERIRKDFSDGSRKPKPNKNGYRTLTAGDVREIRRMRDEGVKPSAIAKHFNSSVGAIYSVLSGRTWKEVK